MNVSGATLLAVSIAAFAVGSAVGIGFSRRVSWPDNWNVALAWSIVGTTFLVLWFALSATGGWWPVPVCSVLWGLGAGLVKRRWPSTDLGWPFYVGIGLTVAGVLFLPLIRAVQGERNLDSQRLELCLVTLGGAIIGVQLWRLGKRLAAVATILACLLMVAAVVMHGMSSLPAR